MSYRVLIDGEILCSSNAEDTAIINPIVKLAVNKAGTFTFGMMPTHPYYGSVQLRRSIIDVYQNGELIFEGVPVSEKTDFWKQKTVSCEGDLTFLNDTILRQLALKNQTVISLLGEYLQRHNTQVGSARQFQVGTVTVDGGSSIYRYTNYNTTMESINDDLIDNFGGFLRVRHDQGVRYLDYLSSSPHTSSQVIRIGKNLTDLNTNIDTLDIATVLIPLGAKTGKKAASGADRRLTVSSVNDGKDYVIGTASSYYGAIWRTKTWDDVTVASNLLTKAQNYLADAQWANLTIEASALDLGLVSQDVEQFHLLDQIRVVSDPHGIDRYFLLSQLEINLNNPGETRITLGQDFSTSLSSKVAESSQELQNTPTIINVEAREQARQLLDSATGGNIYFVYDADGVCTEIRIMDTNDPQTATKIWRWNINGWGYSGDGGQTYTVAATMNGAIVADFITAGTLQGINIKGVNISGESTLTVGAVVTVVGSNYSATDLNRITQIILGQVTPTSADYTKLDVNRDGVIDLQDRVIIQNAINDGSVDVDLTVTIDASRPSTELVRVGTTKIGVNKVYADKMETGTATITGNLSATGAGTFGGDVYAGGHGSPIGTVETKNLSTDVALSSTTSSVTTIDSIELTPGTWVIVGTCRFKAAGMMARQVVTIASTAERYNVYSRQDLMSISGENSVGECTAIVTPSTITTYYMSAASAVATDVLASGTRIRAVRIA